tara:strand:- start:442 stop:1185 length:744 start_codon:yes stop_codon:yes gene_type:complete
MIINHKYKFIFFKTRKTASTSIEIALSKYCSTDDIITGLPASDEAIRESLGYLGPQNWEISKSLWHRLMPVRPRSKRKYYLSSHATARSVMQWWIDAKMWESYFKFCFIRNPFDVAISRYWWERSQSPSISHDINIFIKNSGCPCCEKSHIIKPTDTHSWSGNWEIYGQDDGTVLMDFIGRYESLQDNLNQISEILSLGKIDLPDAKRQHREDHRHYSCVLNEESRAKIEKSCKWELEPMGYKWELP